MCLVVLLGAFFPRVAIFIMWLFTNKLSLAFNSFWLGLAGFLFLPFTTFFYALAYAPVRGVSGIGWFFVILGFLLDLSNWFGGGRYAPGQYRRYRAV
jgi:hypothetical protein